MASIDVDTCSLWKTLTSFWESYTIFGKDFNPRQSDLPMWDPEMTTSWETSYDLSWFQAWNEVCFCALVLYIDWLSGVEISYTMRFQKYVWWWQNAWWTDSFTDSASYSGYWYSLWYYVGVDWDEIWTDATRYRFLYDISGWGVHTTTSAEFTVSWLSFDSSLHPAWYLRVQWTQLCFTDWTWGWTPSNKQWYKHIINIDSSYPATNVWSWNAWHIWLPDNSSDDHIYYVDANWYKRRTKASQTWWDEDYAYAGSNKKWYMWVSDGDVSSYGYGHLCYVNNAWYKRRICNWWI